MPEGRPLPALRATEYCSIFLGRRSLKRGSPGSAFEVPRTVRSRADTYNTSRCNSFQEAFREPIYPCPQHFSLWLCSTDRTHALGEHCPGGHPHAHGHRTDPVDTPGSADHNYTFFATDIVLQRYGFVEEEFFFDGTANRYDAAAPSGGVGNAAAAPRSPTSSRPNIPYRSRLRVIRPTDPAKFNGTVIVEWTNVTNGYDTPVWWLKPKAFYLREGYAYVEVSAQNAGLEQHAQRFAQLEPDALRVAQRERRRRSDRRRLVVRHLLAGRRGSAQRAGGAGRLEGAGRHRRRRVAIRRPAGRVRECRSPARPCLRRHHHVGGRRDHLQQRRDAGHEGAERDRVRGSDQRDQHAAARYATNSACGRSRACPIPTSTRCSRGPRCCSATSVNSRRTPVRRRRAPASRRAISTHRRRTP